MTTSDLHYITNILLHSKTYMDACVDDRHTEKLWIWQNNYMQKKEITFAPGLYHVFDQILVNAANKQRDPTMNRLKVNINVADNLICVWNNGDSIPDLLTIIHPNLFPNTFFTQMTIETADVKLKKRHKMVFTSTTMIFEPTTTCDDSIQENWTMVSYKPHLGLEDDFASLMKRRVVDIAGCVKGVNVELDGTHVRLDTFQDYVKLYLGTLTHTSSIYEQVNDRLEICVVIADGHHFEQVSFVNNATTTTKGGLHVDYITGQITCYLGKVVNLKPDYIKSCLWLFVNARIENPTLDSETIKNLTTNNGSFGSTCKLTPQFFRRIANFEVMHILLSSYAASEENGVIEKINGKGEWKLINIPQLADAYFSATDYSEECTLILTYGGSAEAFAMSGLSFVGQDYYGIFPLSLNLTKERSQELQKNTEIQNFKKILGLEDGKVYENVKELRYGHLMLMADQDHGGSLFKGLLIKFLYSFFPALLKVPNFLLEFKPPIATASNKETQKMVPFYTMPEYEAWKKKLGNEATNYKTKYCEGLGMSETEEVKEYFADLDNYTNDFVWANDEDGNAIEVAFDEMKINESQHWIRAHQAVDSKEKHIRYRDFINKEFILPSNQISIPSYVDGLNLVERKILFCAYKKPINENFTLSEFIDYVSLNSAYHHRKASLNSSIVGMTQEDYVGSNNINLLERLFGTRLTGGRDNTQLSHITRSIFHKADERFLNYLVDHGQSIEPAWFIPIIPMVLVNGSGGTGIGWSSFIPNYNPRDIIANLVCLLKGEAIVPMNPWYKGFRGSIKKKYPASKYYTATGCFVEKEGQNVLTVTQLPVGKSTHSYEEFLQTAKQDGKNNTPFIQDYTAHNVDETVHFEIFMTKDQMNTARQEGFAKKFKLTTTLSTDNMHMFDANGVIKKYDTPEQILEEFIGFRLDFYEKRRTAQLCELKEASTPLKSKVDYLRLVCEGKIRLINRTYKELCDELEKRGFKKELEVEDVVAAGEEKLQGNASKMVPGYYYLLSIDPRSLNNEKLHELQQEMDEKEKKIDELTKATSKSLWRSDLEALDNQLKLEEKYPSPKSFPEITKEAPKKKAPAKRVATTSPLPQRANKKRLKR